MILPELKTGERLIFIRDYGNKYDENAIKVFSRNGDHIGYIQKDLAADIAPFLDENIQYDLEGIVSQVTGGYDDNKNYGCNIHIWLSHSESDDINNIISDKKSKNTGAIYLTLIVYGIAIILAALVFTILYFKTH